MFVVNDDLSIYATRGDIVFFSVTAEDNGEAHKFQPGDVVRIKVYGKKDAESVVLQKDFPVVAETESVEVYLTEQDTKIGEVISKPKDYWYEIELNPYNNPQTIIGYDEDGAKVFKLFPEGDDIPEFVPDPEDIKVIDDELDLTSDRPVRNQAIARAMVNLERGFEETQKKTDDTAEAIAFERTRIDNLISQENVSLSQNLEYLEFITEETKAKIDGNIKSDGVSATITVNWREANQVYGGTEMSVFVIPSKCRPMEVGAVHTEDGLEYNIKYDGSRYYMSFTALNTVAPSGAGTVTFTYALGDYELKDIRLGADGVVYDTAGMSVREQVKKVAEANEATLMNAINGNLLDVSTITAGKYLSGTVNGGITIKENELYCYTDYIRTFGKPVLFGGNMNLNNAIYFYDKDKKAIANRTIRDVNGETPPVGSEYIRFNCEMSRVNTSLVCWNETDIQYGLAYGEQGIPFEKVVGGKEYVDELRRYVDNTTEDYSYLIESLHSIGVVGDSMASGECYYKNESGSGKPVDLYQFSWGQYLARRHGVSCYNFSKGGMTTKGWLTAKEGLALAQQNPCNCYIIGLGINDANNLGDSYLGTKNDIKDDFSMNEDSFYGNYGKIIGYLKAIQPKAVFFLLTIPHRLTNTKRNFNEAIREISAMFENCHLIDMEDDSFYLTDIIAKNTRSGHFNAIGYNATSVHMAKVIGKYMYENIESFNQVEFIGTDYSWYD